jgi:sarcosine oxidase subunit alpha
VRPVKLEDLVDAVHEVIEQRTGLHDLHLRDGARMQRSGAWLRPATYGDVLEEHRAVRERVGVMDVGTLGKFLVGGRDAFALLDAVLPIRLDDLAPGRSRYFVALDEGGYVLDDGLVCALADGGFYITSTSGGADRFEAWLRDRADRSGLHTHLINQTDQLGAINVAGPRARELLASLSDDDLSRTAIPYPGHAEVTVAGVPCRAITSGFVGELAFELHHPRSRGVGLWDALRGAGGPWELRPHGLDALDLLRLEKGHPYLGQDTLPDDHPAKLGLAGLVGASKPWFVGKRNLARIANEPLDRKLVGLRFDAAPARGAPLRSDGVVAGRITSCATSPTLGHAIGLGWVRAVDGAFPTELDAGGITASVVPTPFYDPEGSRLRA